MPSQDGSRVFPVEEGKAAVQRTLAGESVEVVAREIGAHPVTVTGWRRKYAWRVASKPKTEPKAKAHLADRVIRAMAGMMDKEEMRELIAAMALTGFAAGDEPMTEEEAARRCVVCADALLAELARPA